MECFYQLILLGNFDEVLRQQIERALKSCFKNLGVDDKFLKILEHSMEYDKRMPAYCVYCGGTCHAEEIFAEKLMLEGVSVLPVVKDADAARDDLSMESVKAVNACFWNQGVDKVVSTIMANFGLIRKRRKVFISYKRVESRDVAVQLYEKLNEAGFYVFLDTHSIQKGDDFQEDLYHQLMDSDVVVLLDTPKFFESRWTKIEFRKANSMSMGIVLVLWPDVKLSQECLLTSQIALNANSFDSEKNSILSSSSVNEIIDAVEKMRIRSFAARMRNLTSNLLEFAKNKCEKISYIGMGLYKNENSGEHYIPEVGYPQSESFDFARKQNKEKCVVVYDPTNVKSSWLDYLNWVNGSLAVKTKPISDGV